MSVKTVLVDGGPPVAVKSDAGARFIYNLLPVGRFYDKRYGEIYVGDEMLRKMEANFGRYPSYEVPVKVGHGDGAPSPGKVIGLAAKPEGLEITMMVDAPTAEAINKKQYRYMSAEFDENYADKATGAPVGAVLLGAALVNQPANPYMAPLVLADDVGNLKNGRNEDMDAVELLKKQLSDIEEREKKARADFEASLQEAKTKDAEAQKKIAELESEKKALADERAKVAREKLETEVKAFCDGWAGKGVPPAVLEKVKPVLLSEGRVIKLSDKEEAPLIKVFGEVFEAMPKVAMGQLGFSEAPNVELSDVEKAKARGAQIAASVSPKAGK